MRAARPCVHKDFSAYIRMVAPYKELGRTYARAILGIGNLDFTNQNATQFRNTKTKKGLG